jgi:hypothetical protein
MGADLERAADAKAAAEHVVDPAQALHLAAYLAGRYGILFDPPATALDDRLEDHVLLATLWLSRRDAEHAADAARSAIACMWQEEFPSAAESCQLVRLLTELGAPDEADEVVRRLQDAAAANQRKLAGGPTFAVYPQWVVQALADTDRPLDAQQVLDRSLSPMMRAEAAVAVAVAWVRAKNWAEALHAVDLIEESGRHPFQLSMMRAGGPARGDARDRALSAIVQGLLGAHRNRQPTTPERGGPTTGPPAEKPSWPKALRAVPAWLAPWLRCGTAVAAPRVFSLTLVTDLLGSGSIKYNRPSGTVTVTVGTAGSALTVENTGPMVPAKDVAAPVS